MTNPSSVTSSGAERENGARLGLAVVIALALLLTFGRSLFGDYVYDDESLVLGNPRIQSFAGVLEGFQDPHFGFEDAAAEARVGYWRPLTVATLALGRFLGGGRPLGFHAISLMLHFLATLVCWRIARRLTGNTWLAFFAALLFGLHPVHAESVAWISAVNDPLFGLFALLSLNAFLRWRGAGSGGMPIAAGLWLVPALLAKEQALAVLPMAVALDFGLYFAASKPAPSNRGEETELLPLARAYAPLLAAVALYWLARVFVFGDLLAGFDRTNAAFGMDLARGATYRIELAGGFLGLLFWPVELAVFRPFRPELPPLDAAFYAAAACLALWLAATAYTWKTARKVALALLLFLPAALTPVLVYLDAVGTFPMSDRYLYLPAVAATMLLAIAAARILPRPARYAVLAGIAALFGARTYAHTLDFRDQAAFYAAALEESPRVPSVHWGYGRMLLQRYDVERDKALLDEALYHYLVSLSLGTDYGDYGPKLPADAPMKERTSEMIRVVNDTKPEYRRRDPSVHVDAFDRLQANLGQGWCYLFLADLPPEYDLDFPLQVFKETARIFPNSYHALTGLGTVHMRRGEYEAALDAFGEAIKRNRLHAEAWHNLGKTYSKRAVTTGRDDWEQARLAFQQAMKLRPNRVQDLLGAAVAAIEVGRDDMASGFLKRARTLEPNGLQPLYWTGMLAARKGEFSIALSWFDRALGLSAEFGLAHYQRGRVMYRLGREEEAIKSLRRACGLIPDHFEAHYNLGEILRQRGFLDAAFTYLDRAYALSPEDGTLRAELHRILVELVPHEPDQTFRLGLLSERRYDWPRALDWMELTIERFPDWEGLPDVYHRAGRAQQQLERYEAAVAAYEQCLELTDDHFWAHHDLGILLARFMGRLEESRPYLERALVLFDAAESRIGANLRAAVRGNIEATLAATESILGPPAPPIEPRKVTDH